MFNPKLRDRVSEEEAWELIDCMQEVYALSHCTLTYEEQCDLAALLVLGTGDPVYE